MDASGARALAARLEAGGPAGVDDLEQAPGASDAVRSAIIGRMDELGGATDTPQPSTDELASVLASVIGSSRTVEDIRDYTGVAWDSVTAAVAQLSERAIIHEIVGGHFHARQGVCAGPCSRGGSDVRGQEVVINATTLRWMCDACWSAGEAPRPSVAPSGDVAMED